MTKRLKWFCSLLNVVSNALSLHVGGVCISPSNATCNLEAMMDSAGSMSSHVSRLCKSASFALWRISRIRNYFNQLTTLELIHAFVTSMMDYRNDLLFGLPSREIRNIQIIHNSAVHLVTKARKYNDITSILQGLPRLTVHQCVKFKLICITYKIIYCAAPNMLERASEYLCSTKVFV